MKKHHLLVGIVCLVLLLATGISFAQEVPFFSEEQPQEGTPQGLPEKPVRGAQGRLPGPGGRPFGRGEALFPLRSIIRGEFVVDSLWGAKVLRIDRGEVISVSEKEISIKERDGREATIPINKKTRIVQKRQKISSQEVKEGDRVDVLRTRQKDRKWATLVIRVFPKEQGPQTER